MTGKKRPLTGAERARKSREKRKVFLKENNLVEVNRLVINKSVNDLLLEAFEKSDYDAPSKSEMERLLSLALEVGMANLVFSMIYHHDFNDKHLNLNLSRDKFDPLIDEILDGVEDGTIWGLNNDH